ncbi:MAG TPA: ATP-binding protein [Azospirillaceae bacterium]|nr:ATP-binding protein [Azospirillaceae bacterium]
MTAPGGIMDRDGTGTEAEGLREFLDRMAPLAWLADARGAIVWCSRRWVEHTGAGAEALAATGGWTSLLEPGDATAAAEVWGRCLAAGTPFDRVVRLRGKDGTARPFLAQIVPHRGPDGAAAGWCATLAETAGDAAAPRAEARRLEILNRTGTLLAAELDLERLLQAITDAAVEVTGAQFGAFFYSVVDDEGQALSLYTLSGMPHAAFDRFPMPRMTEVFGPTLRGEAVVRSGDITQDPRYGRNAPHRGMPDGHPPVRSYLALPVVARTGEVQGALFFGHAEPDVFDETAERIVLALASQAAVAIDNARLFKALQRELAERRRTEEALRETEARFRDMADHAPEVVWVTDPRGDCTYISRRWTERTGMPAEQALGLGWLDTVHPDERDAVGRIFLEANAARVEFRSEYRVRGADGTYRWSLDTAAPRFDEAGAFLGYVGSMVDIHERRLAEERLRAANDVLQAASAAKSAFLASVSHELRTPLNAVIGFSEILSQELYGPIGSPRYREYAGDILDSGRMLLRLVDDVLDMARIEAGRIELHEEPVPLDHLVRDVRRALARPAEEAGILVAAEVPDPAPAVRGDRLRLRQILLNLVGNAIKFTPAGGRVEVTVRGATITVSDTGIGIPPERIPDLGRPFTQVAGNVLARRHAGTGMGLYIARSLVERHGGTLTIESAAGAGTTVTVALPPERLFRP